MPMSLNQWVVALWWVLASLSAAQAQPAEAADVRSANEAEDPAEVIYPNHPCCWFRCNAVSTDQQRHGIGH